MKPVAWRYENKNVKGNWYITWKEPPDGFNKRPLYEHPPQEQEAAKDLERQLAESEQDRQDQIDLTVERYLEVEQLRKQLTELADKVREECAQICEKNLYAWNGTSDRNDDYRNAHRKDMREIRAMKERP